MEKSKFSFEKMDEHVSRLSINESVFFSKNDLLVKILNGLFDNNDKLFLFGVKENEYWASKNELQDVKQNVIKEFEKTGYYKTLFEKNDTLYYVHACINKFDSLENAPLIMFWVLFENVFILKINDPLVVNVLGSETIFSFKKYTQFLKQDKILFSICKPEEGIVCIDSANPVIFEKMQKLLNT